MQTPDQVADQSSTRTGEKPPVVTLRLAAGLQLGVLLAKMRGGLVSVGQKYRRSHCAASSYSTVPAGCGALPVRLGSARKARLFGYRRGRPGATHPTDTGVAGAEPEDLPTGWVPERRTWRRAQPRYATGWKRSFLSRSLSWHVPRTCGERPAREGGDFPTGSPRALSPPRVPLREAFETLDRLKRHPSRAPLHRGSLLAFFGCAATLAAFWAVCDGVAWPLSLTAFVTCFDAATRPGTARVPT